MIGSGAKAPHIFPSTVSHIPHLSDSSRDSSPFVRNRKRKRSRSEDGEESSGADDVGWHLPGQDSSLQKKRKVEVPMTCIRPPGFVYPKTAYSGHIPSMPRYAEESVLRDILVGRVQRFRRSHSEAKLEGRSKRKISMTPAQMPMTILLSRQISRILSSTVPISPTVTATAVLQNILLRMSWYLFTRSTKMASLGSTLTAQSATLVDGDTSSKSHLRSCL